jgi:hypothetical protein
MSGFRFTTEEPAGERPEKKAPKERNLCSKVGLGSLPRRRNTLGIGKQLPRYEDQEW